MKATGREKDGSQISDGHESGRGMSGRRSTQRSYMGKAVPMFEKSLSDEGEPTSRPLDVYVQEENRVDKHGTVPRTHMLGYSTLL